MRLFKALGPVLFLSICTTAFVAAPISSLVTHFESKANGLERRQGASSGPPPGYPSLAPRQAGTNNNNNGNGDTCECVTKCPNKHLYIDPKNCSRCLRCPGNKVADPKSNYEKCVPDHGQTEDDAQKRREDKENKWPDKKKRMSEKFKGRTSDRKKNNDERKAKRMSLCVPIATMGLKGYVARLYMNGFFSEEYLESGEIVEYWPEDLVIEEWELDTWDDADEETFYNGGYLDAWVDYAAETWNVDEWETDLARRDTHSDPTPTVGRHRRDLQKRRVSVLVRGVVWSIQSIGNRRYLDFVTRQFKDFLGNRGPTLGNGKSREAQGKAVKGMMYDGPLQWCLRRQTPRNHT